MPGKPRDSVLQLHFPDGWPESVEPEARFRYALYEGRERTTGVARLEDVPHAATVIAVAPASVATFVRASLPAARPGKMSALLAHAVEDAIATSPEEVHAVLVEHVPDGQSLIAVVNRGWLGKAIAALTAAGIVPDRFILETELAIQRAAEEAANTWLVVRSRSGGFAVLADGELMALDVGDAPGYLPLALQLARDSHRRRGEIPDEAIVLSASRERPLDVERWSMALGLPVRDAGKWRPEQIDARPRRATDLLRGDFARGWSAEEITPTLKRIALAAAAVLVLHAAFTAVDWWRLSSEADRLNAAMEARFRQVFPQTQTIVDAPLQMRRNLVELKRQAGIADASDFVPLLAAIAPNLDAQGIEVERMQYQRGELELQVRLPEGAAKERLETQLARPGYRVRVERLSTGQSGNAALLRITAEA